MSIEEGIIKFHGEWKETKPFEDDMLNELITYRKKLIDNKLIGCNPDGIGYGNISIRKKENAFYISGSATGDVNDFDEKHISMVSDFNLKKNKLTCSGPVKASSESLSHAAIYKALPAINAVIHIHNGNMWEKHINKLPTTRKDIPYGTPEMANEIIRLLKNSRKTIIMGGHEEGIVCYGATLKEAYKEVEILLNSI